MGSVRIDTRTASGQSCVGAKRIYAMNLMVKWNCPECHEQHREKFDEVPLISYGHYCHCFYCDDCGYESGEKEKMYEINKINNDYVELTFSEMNNLKPFKSQIEYIEL